MVCDWWSEHPSVVTIMHAQESKDLPAVKQMLATAKAILGYDLLEICLNGPKEKLDDTTVAQPALFIAGLAAVERLRSTNSKAVDGCSATAGLSLGEYCALVFAGAMSFEDGLKVRWPCMPCHAILQGSQRQGRAASGVSPGWSNSKFSQRH